MRLHEQLDVIGAIARDTHLAIVCFALAGLALQARGMYVNYTMLY